MVEKKKKGGQVGKKLGGAVGGILAGELAKSAVAKKAYKSGALNPKMVKSGGRAIGEKLGSLLPFARGGVVIVVPKKKRRSKK